eukprot:12532916-Alexandrium_andersonii.AAC.1
MERYDPSRAAKSQIESAFSKSSENLRRPFAHLHLLLHRNSGARASAMHPTGCSVVVRACEALAEWSEQEPVPSYCKSSRDIAE